MTIKPTIKIITRALALAAIAAAALGTAACRGEEERPAEETVVETRSAAELSPEELGRLGARLSEEPERSEQILREEGLVWEDYAEAVRSVAEDVQASRRYEEAFRGGEAQPPGQLAEVKE